MEIYIIFILVLLCLLCSSTIAQKKKKGKQELRMNNDLINEGLKMDKAKQPERIVNPNDNNINNNKDKTTLPSSSSSSTNTNTNTNQLTSKQRNELLLKCPPCRNIDIKYTLTLFWEDDLFSAYR